MIETDSEITRIGEKSTAFGFSRIIDWDREAMTAIEGVNSEPVGGIDRNASPLWRNPAYVPYGREKNDN